MEGEPEARATETREVWKRGLFMLLCVIGFSVGHFVLNLVAVVQFLWLLLAHEPNQPLLRFGRSLATWFADTARFLSCATDAKPFPWQDWPDTGGR